jgi:hypothetical protein
MAMIEQLPLLGSAALPADWTDTDPLRPAGPLSPLAEYLALFVGWVGFWFAVIWWIV